MKLYDAARCPFCARVRLARAKQAVMRLREVYGATFPDRIECWLETLAARPAVAAELELVGASR